MKERAAIRAFRNNRGMALPAVFALILLLSTLYFVALDRTLAERNHVLAFYYENVALDLAESGVALAQARLAQGGTAAQTLRVDAFRGLEGTIQVKVEPAANGRYLITSTGLLTDRSGRVRYSTLVTVRGRLVPSGASKILQIEEFREVPSK